MFDKKRQATTVVAKRDPATGDRTMSPTPMVPEEVTTEEGELDGRHLAAQDMIAAIKEGSAEKLNAAMQAHHDLHKAMGSKPEPEE